MEKSYQISKDTNGLYYVHKVGFSNIPVLGSFKKTKKEAITVLCQYLCIPRNEYKTIL